MTLLSGEIQRKRTKEKKTGEVKLSQFGKLTTQFMNSTRLN